MATPAPGLSIGPLQSTVEVVAFVALTGAAWFNAGELLWTILASFARWTGKYFYCLIVATLGVAVYQLNVFFMIFAPNFNGYGVIACIGIGWSMMVTGQSLVLWSRLHLVCRSAWKLKAILIMIIVNACGMHGVQFVFSLLAVKNNAIDPTYKPFEVMEKISIVILTLQELIISSVYIFETVRILQTNSSMLSSKKSNRRRIQMLFLANIAIICIDVITVSLEFAALWGVWCSFKGFGYSVKLKIEFAILNQLRDSVKREGSSSNGYGYGQGVSDSDGMALSSRSKRDKKSRTGTKPGVSALERQTFDELDDDHVPIQVTKTTQISVRHEDKGLKESGLTPRVPGHPPSESSSEIEFATKGV